MKKVHAWSTHQVVVTFPTDERDLVERYLPLVRGVVDQIKTTLPPHIEATDLYIVGVTGLIAAVRKFNPNKGSAFASYAKIRVRGAILDELRRMDWCPRRIRARTRKFKEAVIALEQRLGHDASTSEICEGLSLTPQKCSKLLGEAQPVTFVAIDQKVNEEDPDAPSIYEFLADQSDETGREKMEREELKDLIAERISELPDIPRKILVMRYFENMRMAEIAQILGLTESRIFQIHKKTILELRFFVGRARNH